jgi:hypothetical protein
MENEKKNFFGKGSSIGIGSLGAGKAIEFFKKGTIFGLIGGFIMAIIEAIFGILGKAEQEQKPDAEVEQEVSNYIQNATLAEYAKHSPSELLKNSDLKLTDEQIKNMQALTKIYSAYGNDKGVESRYAFLLNEAVEFLDTPQGKIKADNMAKLPFVKNQMNAIVDKDALYKLSSEDKDAIKEAIASGNLEKLTPEQKELYSLIRKVTLANVVVDEHSFLNVRETGIQNVNEPFYYYDKGSKGAFGQQQIMKETFAESVYSKLGREAERASYSAEYAELVKSLGGRTPNLKDPKDVEAVLDIMIAKSANVQIGSDEFNAVKAKYNQDWVRDYLSGKVSMTDSDGNPSAYAKLKGLGDEVLVGSLFKYMGSEKGYVRFCLDLGYDKTANYNLQMTMEKHLGYTSIKSGEQAMNAFHNLLISDKDEERALAGKILVLNFGDNRGKRTLSETEQLRVIDSVFKASGLEPKPHYGSNLEKGYLALANAARENPWVYDTMLKYRDWYGYSSSTKNFNEFMTHMFVNSFGNKYAEFDKMGVKMNGGYDGVVIPNPQKYSPKEIEEGKKQLEAAQKEEASRVYVRGSDIDFLSNIPEGKTWNKTAILKAIDDEIAQLKENNPDKDSVSLDGKILATSENGILMRSRAETLDGIKKEFEPHLRDDVDYKKLGITEDSLIYATLSGNKWTSETLIQYVSANPQDLEMINRVNGYRGVEIGLSDDGKLGATWDAYYGKLSEEDKKTPPYSRINEAIKNNDDLKELKLTDNVKLFDLILLSKKEQADSNDYNNLVRALAMNGAVDSKTVLKGAEAQSNEQKVTYQTAKDAGKSEIEAKEAIELTKANEKIAKDNVETIEKRNKIDVSGYNQNITHFVDANERARLLKERTGEISPYIQKMDYRTLNNLAINSEEFKSINPFTYNEVFKNVKDLNSLYETPIQNMMDVVKKSNKPEDCELIKDHIGKGLSEDDRKLLGATLKDVFNKEEFFFFDKYDEVNELTQDKLKSAFLEKLLENMEKGKTPSRELIERMYNFGYLSKEEVEKSKNQILISTINSIEAENGADYAKLEKEHKLRSAVMAQLKDLLAVSEQFINSDKGKTVLGGEKDPVKVAYLIASGSIDNQHLVEMFRSKEKIISNKFNSSSFPVELYNSYGNKLENVTVVQALAYLLDANGAITARNKFDKAVEPIAVAVDTAEQKDKTVKNKGLSDGLEM